MSSTQKIQFANFIWLNLENPEEKDAAQLGQKYGFHPLDLADCLTQNHRTKIDIYQKYAFLVFLGVVVVERENIEKIVKDLKFAPVDGD